MPLSLTMDAGSSRTCQREVMRMQNVWLASAVWIGLALLASIISIRVAMSIALVEIVVGAVAGNVIHLEITPWVDLPRRLRRHPADLPGRNRDRPASRAQALLVEHEHRDDRFSCALSRGHAVCPLRPALAMAAGADRRHFAVHDVGRRRLRGDGGDRLEQDRARQDHPWPPASSPTSARCWRSASSSRTSMHGWPPFGAATSCSRHGCCRRLAPWFFARVGQRVSEPETKFLWLIVLLSLGGLSPPPPAARRCCRPTS